MTKSCCALTEALEVQFTLENMIDGVAVLARVAVVDLVVRAHDGAYSCLDGICEGPGKR